MKIGFAVVPTGYFRMEAGALNLDEGAIAALMERYAISDPAVALQLEIERERPGAAHTHPLMVKMLAEANRLQFMIPAGHA